MDLKGSGRLRGTDGQAGPEFMPGRDARKGQSVRGGGVRGSPAKSQQGHQDSLQGRRSGWELMGGAEGPWVWGDVGAVLREMVVVHEQE